eukprot:GDKH01008388.1.p1 GENE.GDKH01008388.1~~GDKH01008388.1.p1  ORF type:complete len:126 (-),score=18.12 GDKH01008388.1:66-443(-)
MVKITPVAGKPKSGRVWKDQAERHSACFASVKKFTLEERMAKKLKDQETKRVEKEMKDARAAVREKRKLRLKEKRRIKEENEIKSSSVQVIRNAQKLKAMSKKARRHLTKVSPELLRKINSQAGM